MGRPPFLWIVLLTLAAFLGSVSAANFEWMCEKSGAMVVTEPCELTCHCSTGLTQPVGKLVCYDSDTSNVMDNDDACDGIPEPGGDPCEPAVGSCEWLCRFKGSSESHASCEAPSGTPVCDCGSVAELDSKCDVKVNGLSVTSEAAAPYCAGNAPTTTGCPDCPAQWLCVQPADADSGRNPQVCSDPRCACQTGELSFDGLKPVCFQSGNFHSEANYGEGGVIGDACSDAPSLLPGDEECLENSCPWKCTEYGAVDTAVVECDAGNNIFPECVVPNNCGSHTVEAKIVCVDGSDLNTLLSEDKCSGKKPNATDTTHTCQETKGCGRWLCLTPEKPNDPKACEKICGSGCGNGTEEFVYGSPRCVVRGPGGLVNFVKEVEEEPLFCPESNENEKRPELTECSDTDGCAVYCRAPSDTAATPSKCSTSVFEQWSPCKAPDSCGIGEASTHFVCFDERTSESVDMGICTDAGTTAPVDEVSECTIYSGCGSWQCISDDGSLAPCDIICPVGCGTSREVITNGSPVCVYQGVVVSDPDEADVRCPPGNPASPKPDLKECTQTSRCDYYCRHPEASSQGSEGMVPCDDLSAWTTCNALDLCGSGNATTKSLCYDTLAKTLADSAFCVGANIVPVDELRSCTEFSGCGKWRCREDDDQPFSECHAECPEGCGPATEVLNGEPECVKEIDGKWVPTHSELCPSANVEERLPLPQPCNSTSACEWLCMIETNGVLDRKTLQSCTDTHWNPCPTSCTVNSATRFVGCYAAPSGTDEPITMDEDFCLAKTNEAGEPNSRPEDVKTCEDVSECLFSWKCAKTAVDTFTGCDGESTWSTCSESCGQGSSSRVTACYDQHGERRNDHYCTSTRPLEQKSCSGTNCDYVWGCHVGSPVYRSCSDDDNWGECSSSCGTGLKERTASCFTKIKSGTHVLETDSSKCKGSEPSTRSGCSSKAGCSWKFPDWEACPCKSSSSSPNHRMTRKGECQDALGNPGNATLCVEKNGPGEEQRECTGAPVCVAGMTPQWYVATGNSAWSQCVGECGWGIRTRLVDCRYVPDGSKPSESHDVIGDEFCSEASRPDDWGKCNVAASCNHAPPDSGIVSGVCVPAPATRSDMTPLPEKLGLTKGVCQCQNGYYGQMCDTPSTIEDATISPHGANMFFPGVTVKVEWRITSGVNLPITITIRRTNGRSPAVITLIQGSITAPVLVKIPDSIPIGDYLLRVHISEAVYAETFFAVVPACSGVDNDGKSICGQGTCNASTGKCECNKGFTGELCNVDLCTDAQCNVLGTKSCDKDTGTCICNDDYVAGSLRCLTPKSCSTNLKCANNGALVTDESGSCNSCFCHSPWSGPTCEQCPLECHKGIQKDCKECECSLGYTLDSDGKCTCRFIEMKFAFRLSMTPLESSNQDDIIAWRTSLEWDLNVLLNGLNDKTFVARFVSESRVTSGGVKYTMVTLAVRSWCDPRFSVKSIESDGSSFVSQEEAFKSLSARAEWTSSTHEQQRIFSALENLEANDLVMFDAYKAADTFKTQFANRELNSESVLAAAHIPAGIGMFDPGCNSGSACITSLGNGGVMMADPDIPDSGGSEKSGGGGLSTTDLIIVICAVAGGVVLLIIIFVLLARCNGWCCFAAVQRPSQRTSATFQGGQSFDERRRSNRDGKGQSGRSGRSRKKPSTQWDPRDSDMPRTPWNI